MQQVCEGQRSTCGRGKKAISQRCMQFHLIHDMVTLQSTL